MSNPWATTNLLKNTYIDNDNYIDGKYSLKVLGKSGLLGGLDVSGIISFLSLPSYTGGGTPTFTGTNFITKDYGDANYSAGTGDACELDKNNVFTTATGNIIQTKGTNNFWINTNGSIGAVNDSGFGLSNYWNVSSTGVAQFTSDENRYKYWEFNGRYLQYWNLSGAGYTFKINGSTGTILTNGLITGNDGIVTQSATTASIAPALKVNKNYTGASTSYWNVDNNMQMKWNNGTTDKMTMGIDTNGLGSISAQNWSISNVGRGSFVALTVNNTAGITATTAGMTIDFSGNAPIMSGANIKTATIPESAINSTGGTYVTVGTTQNITGEKTYQSNINLSDTYRLIPSNSRGNFWINNNNTTNWNVGTNNVALGYNCGNSISNSASFGSVAIGSESLQNVANPQQSIAIGYQCLKSATSSLTNTAVGTYCGLSMINNCNSNNFFGAAAGNGIISNSSYNWASGESAMSNPSAASIGYVQYLGTNVTAATYTLTLTTSAKWATYNATMIGPNGNGGYKAQVIEVNLSTNTLTFDVNTWRLGQYSYIFFYERGAKVSTTYTGATATNTTFTIATGLSILATHQVSYYETSTLNKKAVVSSYNSATGALVLTTTITLLGSSVMDFYNATQTKGDSLQNNLALGKYAFANISNGSSQNTAIGIGALNGAFGSYNNITYMQGNANTAIGYFAGAFAVNNQNYNTFIGSYADVASPIYNNISSSMAIGNNVKVTKSNQVCIGSTTINKSLNLCGLITYENDGDQTIYLNKPVSTNTITSGQYFGSSGVSGIDVVRIYETGTSNQKWIGMTSDGTIGYFDNNLPAYTWNINKLGTASFSDIYNNNLNITGSITNATADTISNAEIANLTGTTSNVQTQLNTLQNKTIDITFDGTNTTEITGNLQVDNTLKLLGNITNSTGDTISNSEIANLTGTTSNVQSQLNTVKTKTTKISFDGTNTTDISGNLTIGTQIGATSGTLNFSTPVNITNINTSGTSTLTIGNTNSTTNFDGWFSINNKQRVGSSIAIGTNTTLGYPMVEYYSLTGTSNFTVTLPTLSSPSSDGIQVTFLKVSAINTVTINASGGNTFRWLGSNSSATATSVIMAGNFTMMRICGIGSNWDVMFNNYGQSYGALITSNTTLAFPFYDIYSIATPNTTTITITLPAASLELLGKTIRFRRVNTQMAQVNSSVVVYSLTNVSQSVILTTTGYVSEITCLLLTATPTYAWFLT